MASLISEDNPGGKITNSDLECAGLLLFWLVMEHVCMDLREAHAGLFSNNSPIIRWVRHMAAKGSKVAVLLL